jgi:hypothetical protein
MAKTFLITLDAITSPGPFNIYYNTVSSVIVCSSSPIPTLTPTPSTYTIGLAYFNISGAEVYYNWDFNVNRDSYTLNESEHVNGASLFISGTSSPSAEGYYSNGTNHWYLDKTTLSGQTTC